MPVVLLCYRQPWRKTFVAAAVLHWTNKLCFVIVFTMKLVFNIGHWPSQGHEKRLAFWNATICHGTDDQSGSMMCLFTMVRWLSIANYSIKIYYWETSSVHKKGIWKHPPAHVTARQTSGIEADSHSTWRSMHFPASHRVSMLDIDNNRSITLW